MGSTNWDTGRKRCKPPTWDPPKLLLVVSGLNVAVGTSSVAGVVVDGGVWILGSNVWLRHPGRRGKKGEKREQSNREYSSKVLASKDSHYICMGSCVKGQCQCTELQNARIRGG